jgi:hypothetical protein
VKPPGVAEAISWAAALRVLGVASLAEPVVQRSLGAVLKYDEDIQLANATGLAELLRGSG